MAEPTKDKTAPAPKRYRTRSLPFIFYIPGALWRHKGLTLAVLAGLYAADRLYGPQLVAHFEGPPLVTVDAKFCQNETCTNTARTIASATALWIQTSKAMGYDIPSYLNARYALGSAGIESDMGANLHTKGSRYEGIFQLSRRIDDTHFTNIAGELFATLKAAYEKNPNAIPALNEIMIKGKKITPQQLQKLFSEKVSYMTLPKSDTREQPLTYATNELIRLLRTDKKLFNDPVIQTFAFMESSYKQLPSLSRHAHFADLAAEDQHAVMYLAHNLPRAARTTLKQHLCELPIAELSPKDMRFFPGNSGLYTRTGRATPAQVLYRTKFRMHQYLTLHGPRLGDPALATSIAPTKPVLLGEQGVLHRLVLRTLHNKTRCIPNKA